MSTGRRPAGRPFADEAGPSTSAMLDVALRAFADHGYAGTSVRQLARELGVSHNLIPQRFGSKDRLWYAAVDHGFGALLRDLLDVLEEPAEHDVDRLRQMIVRFIEANATRPSLLRIINQEAASPGARFDHLFTTYIEPVRRFGEAVLVDLHERGLVRTRSVAVVYFLMTHGAGGPFAFPALAGRFGETIDVEDPAAVRRHAEDVVDLLFGGLATEY